MLRELTVKNFAVIEELRLEFSPGLNILTGETGAGKSMLIEALGFLLGARASSSWLRAGAPRLEVEGRFDLEDFPRDWRVELKLERGPVAVRRELDAGGKTRALVNGQAVPLSRLSAWGDALVDFHGQHEHQALLRPAVQLDCLDRFGGHAELAEEAARAHAAWSRLTAEREALNLSELERQRRIEWADFQVREIDAAKPSSGEDGEIEAGLPRLKNAERIKGLAAVAYGLLYDEEPSVQGGLLKVERALSELCRVDPSVSDALASLSSARLALSEVAEFLARYRDQIEHSPEKLDAAIARLDLLARLKKKYGPTIEAVLEARENASRELSALRNSAERAGELDAELAAARKTLEEACERLHRARLRAARKLSAAAQKELKALGMPAASFSVAVELEEGRLTRSGADCVEFLLAPNPGEPEKPVRAIASGGELSRVMLALKTVLASADRVPVLVFDEVDAGVGGAVARAVGEKLALLGRRRQVFCVTHLAQVACFGAGHTHLSKEVAGSRTRVRAEGLDGPRRLEVLATMLGGRQATSASRRHAQELLESSAAAA